MVKNYLKTVEKEIYIKNSINPLTIENLKEIEKQMKVIFAKFIKQGNWFWISLLYSS